MNQARVSVFLPVFNGAGKLRRQLESMAAQTFKDFIVTIIDNASEDETPQIAQEFADRYPNFHYIRNRKNLGFHFSYMKGFYLSSDYEFMVYASHNDCWHPEYLEKCVRALDDNPKASIAYSWCQFLDREGRPASIFGPDQPSEPYKDDFDLTSQNGAERFMTIIGQLGMCTAFYGVIRMSGALNSLWSLNCGCLAGDNFFLALMASREGPFVQIPQALFYRELPYAQGQNATDRKVVIHQMNAPKSTSHTFDYGYIDFLWQHAKCAAGTFDDTKAIYADLCDGDIDKYWAFSNRLFEQAIKFLLGRYRNQLESEAEHGVGQVCGGRLYEFIGAPGSQATPVGAMPVRDFMTYTEHYEKLNRIRNFLPDIPDLYTALAICLVNFRRHKEALVLLDEELSRNPTSRQALELKAQLEKHLNRSPS